MAPSENPIGALPPQNDTNERLLAEHRALRQQFHLALAGAIILAGSFCLFLLRELTLVRRQSRELTVFVNEYVHTSLPVMQTFKNKLETYARSHPDFQPILRKYFAGNGAPSESSAAPEIAPALPPSLANPK